MIGIDSFDNKTSDVQMDQNAIPVKAKNDFSSLLQNIRFANGIEYARVAN